MSKKTIRRPTYNFVLVENIDSGLSFWGKNVNPETINYGIMIFDIFWRKTKISESERYEIIIFIELFQLGFKYWIIKR